MTNTPDDTIQKPSTLYGIGKLFGELLGNYYSSKLGLDVRGLRLPGIVSCMDYEPFAGTTDYVVLIFFGAIREKRYTCFLEPETRLPIMYMPDAIKAIIDLAEADIRQLRHHADFNVNAMSFTPPELAAAIRKRIPEFEMDYEIAPFVRPSPIPGPTHSTTPQPEKNGDGSPTTTWKRWWTRCWRR